MITIDKNQYSEIVSQVEKTIDKLKEKEQESGEDYVRNMLEKYNRVQKSLADDAQNIELSELKKLLNGARGYMEVSSDYTQEFLNEMGKTEKLIKSI